MRRTAATCAPSRMAGRSSYRWIGALIDGQRRVDGDGDGCY